MIRNSYYQGIGILIKLLDIINRNKLLPGYKNGHYGTS